MNLRVARQLQRRLRTRILWAATYREARVLRVAFAWLRRKYGDEDDIFKMGNTLLMDQALRLQVLEGAAGMGDAKQPGPWAKMRRASAGLKAAHEWYADKGFTPRPEWFERSEQGVYRMLWKSVDKWMKDNRFDLLQTDEAVSSSLSGVGFALATYNVQERIAWVAGREEASGIRSGSAAPRQVVGSRVFGYIINKLQAIGKAEGRRHEIEMGFEDVTPIGEEGEDVSGDRGLAQNYEEVIEDDVVMRGLLEGNPIGQRVMEIAKSMFRPRGPGRIPLEWLRRTTEGLPKQNKDIAQALGVSPGEVSKQLKPLLTKLMDKVRQDPELQRDIDIHEVYSQEVARKWAGTWNLRASVRTRTGAIVSEGVKVNVSFPPRTKMALCQVLSTGEVFWARPDLLPKLLYRLS